MALDTIRISRGDSLKGVGLIVGSVFLMALQDAVIKLVSSDLTLWQIYVLRSALVIPALVAIQAFSGPPGALITTVGSWTTLRSAFLVLMYASLYAAVPFLDLATIATAFYVGPLFITLLSSIVLHEPVGRTGWVAVCIGFAGVLVILRPGTEAFSLPALLPVLSGLFYALAAVTTRSRCRNVRPVHLALSLNVCLLATGIVASLSVTVWPSIWPAGNPFLFGQWNGMAGREWLFIVLLATLMIGIGIGLAAAYQSAPASVIAPFDFSYLVFAAVWGLILFSDTPDAATFAGMALIVMAGLIVIRRQQG